MSTGESTASPPSGSRLAGPLMHTVHTVTFLALLATGLLLFIPELRSLATGGYSLHLRQIHRWSGVAFAVVPAAILTRYGVRAVFRRGERPNLRNRWKRFHFAATVVMTALFTITGTILWWTAPFTEALVDVARTVHDRLTYAAVAFLGIHLIDAVVGAVRQRISPVGGAPRATPAGQNDKEARHGM